MRRFLLWLASWFAKPPIGTLTMTNQGHADPFAVELGVLLEQTPNGTRWLVVEKTTGKPLVFVGHESTLWELQVDQESGEAALRVSLGRVPLGQREPQTEGATDGNVTHGNG